MSGRKRVVISFVTDTAQENILSVAKILPLVQNLSVMVDDLPAHGEPEPVNQVSGFIQTFPTPTTKPKPKPKPKKIEERYNSKCYQTFKHDKRIVWKLGDHLANGLRYLVFDHEATARNLNMTTAQIQNGHWPRGSLEAALKKSLNRKNYITQFSEKLRNIILSEVQGKAASASGGMND